jgi:hypothetical protein
MKIIFISIVSILLSLDLCARENPFEPTDTFIEIQKQYIITQENQEIERKRIEDEQIAEKLEQDLIENRLVEEKAKELLIVQNRLEEEKLEQEKIKQQLLKKIIEEKIIEEKLEQEKNIKYDVLSFLNVITTTNTLTINVDEKYKLKNQIINHKNHKFVFDFNGKIDMYTKRVKLEHPYFKSITIGSHIKDNFFRVVVVLKDTISNYEENIDNSIIIIKKIK